MWTGAHAAYYTLLRVKNERSRSTFTSKLPAPVDGTGTTVTTLQIPGMRGSSGMSKEGEPFDDEDSFMDPSEGGPKILDPVRSLLLPRKALSKTKELTACRKGITGLHPNFLYLENLEVLVLNKNLLRVVTNLLPPVSSRKAGDGSGPCGGLESGREAPTRSAAVAMTMGDPCGPCGCLRLRQLHLSDNHIDDLSKTDIPRLTSLESLYLANNRLTNLQQVVHILRRRLHALTYLDCRGNPIAEEYGYRNYVIYHLPKVEVLDRLSVSAAERRDAKVQWGNGGIPSGRPVPSTDEVEQDVADATRGNRPSVRTTVAFNTTYHPSAAGKPRPQHLWFKSPCVRDMERRHDKYLHDVVIEAERATQQKAQQIEEMETKRRSFHAIWALSRPSMPLSEEKQRDWCLSTQEMSARAAAAQADMEAELLTTAQHSRRRSNIVNSSSLTRTLSAAKLSPAEVLFEPLPTTLSIPRVALEAGLPNPESMADTEHFSTIFDALLARTNAIKAKSAATNPSWAAAQTPPPKRLQAINAALEATADVLRLGKAPGTSLIPVTRGHHVAPQGEVEQACRPAPEIAAATAPTFDVSCEQLRIVAENKNALIPPPWEDPAGNGGAASALVHASALTLSPPETQASVIELVKIMFIPQECAALETYFGAGEVLQVLALSAASASRGSSAAPASSPTPKRPQSTAGGLRKRRVSAAAANQSATASLLLLQDARLLQLMTSPQLGPSSLVPMHATAAASLQPSSAKSIHNSIGATQLPPVVLPGLVGPYQLGSLQEFMGRLDERSGAWELSLQSLLDALVVAHDVDPTTSTPRRPPKDSTSATVAKTDSPNHLRRGGSRREEREDKKGRGGRSSATVRRHGRGSVVLEVPAVTAASITAVATAHPKAYLTLNNIIGALLCYEPFIASRLAFYEACCRQCAVAPQQRSRVPGEDGDEAPVWFSRAQAVQQHLAAVRRGAVKIVDYDVLSARCVNNVGALFHDDGEGKKESKPARVSDGKTR